MDQKQIVDGLREERERLMEFLRDLPDASWDMPSLCEGWRVRDVVAHLVGNCANVLEQNLEGIGSPEYNQRQIDERAAATPSELLAEWTEKGPGCEAIYEAFPAEMWDFEMGGVIGTIGRGVLRHLEDLWVHAQDVRIPLGYDPTSGPGLDAVIALCETELPLSFEAAGSALGALELRLGDTVRTVTLAGDGDTVHVSGDPIAFALVATGRWALGGAEAEGRLRVDPPLGADEAALGIYGPAFDARA